MPASAVAIEVLADDVDELIVTGAGGAELSRRQVTGSRVVLGPVPLAPGANELHLLARRRGATVETLPLSLTSTIDPSLRIRWTVAPRFVEELPAEIRFEVTATLPEPAKELLIDADGDGTFEVRREQLDPVTTTLTRQGSFAPVVLVRTHGGLLLPQTFDDVQPLRVVPRTALDPTLTSATAVAEPTDLHYEPTTGSLFVLAAQARTVLVFQSDRTLRRTISLATTTEPAGICVSDEGDLLVADRGSHQVFRYRSPTFFLDPLLGSDGAFGSRGAGPGQFESPEDVAVEGTGFDQRVFVCDRGNGRIVCCNRAGVFGFDFDGRDQGAAFDSPTSIATLPSGGIVVLERHQARTMSSDGRTEGAFGRFVDAARVCLDWRQSQIVVTDVGRNTVSLHTQAGALRREVRVDTSVACGTTVALAGGDHIVVGDRATQRMHAGHLLEDPPADGPTEVLRRFLASLAVDDFAAARILVHADSLTTFDTASGNPTDHERIRTDAAALGDPTLVADSPTLAHFRAVRPGTGTAAIADFTLRRDDRGGAWRLFEF